MRKNGQKDFTLLVASAQSKQSAVHYISAKSGSFKLTVEYGDHAAALKKVVVSLQEVSGFALKYPNLENRLSLGICLGQEIHG